MKLFTLTIEKFINLQRLRDEQSCTKGMVLNSWAFQAICNKCFNVKSFIPDLPTHSRSRIVPIYIITSISVCKFKLMGVRLREWPRSSKSWDGSRLCAPKVFPQGCPTPDNNLWLCRNQLLNIYANGSPL